MADSRSGATLFMPTIKMTFFGPKLIAATRLPHDSGSRATRVEMQMGERWRQFVEGLRVIVRKRSILAASGVEAIQYFGMGAMETFLPLYAITRGLNAWQIGVIFGSQTIATAVSKPLMGRVSDRIGRSPMIVVGLVVSALALGGIALSKEFVSLLLVAAIFGLGMAIVTSSTSPFVADCAGSESHGIALGTLSTIMDVGHASGPIVAGLLISMLSYQIGFSIVGSVLGFAAVAFLILARKQKTVAKSSI